MKIRAKDNSASQRGFTLVELLVVITIIGILIAMLLPAVQAAREAGRRATCANHLKQLAVAVESFQSKQGQYPPGGWGNQWAPHPDRGVGMKQPGSWIYSILPQLEQDGLFRLGGEVGEDNETDAALLDGNVQRLGTPLSILHCPTRRGPKAYQVDANSALAHVSKPLLSNTLSAGARSDYACNAGEVRVAFGLGPGNLSEGDDGTYAFPPVNQSTGIIYTRSQFGAAHVTDGTSNTYMLGEKSLDPDQYYNGESPGDDQGPYVADDRDTARFAAGTSTGDYLEPMVDTVGLDHTWRFGSAHPGGFQMAFCDGSVRSMTYGLSEKVHRQLCNRKDGTPIDRSEF